VRQQVMRQVDRLRALQVRVSRHRPVEVGLGLVGEHGHQAVDRLDGVQRAGAHEHRQVGRDLVVARAGRVDLAADAADDLGQPAFDRHVDVLVVGVHLEAAGVDLGANGLEAALELGELAGVDDRAAREHPHVRERLLDVVGGEPEVEADRPVEGVERRVPRPREALGEAGHRARV
jgi:hypothetical protein